MQRVPLTEKEETPHSLLTEAIECHRAGRLIEAEQLYLQAIEAAPQQVAPLYRLGILYFQNGKAEKAISYLTHALRLQPHSSDVLNSLGIASHLAGHDKDAVAYFEKSLVVSPLDLGTLGNLGKALSEQRSFDRALQYFQRIIELDPARLDAYLEAGKCHFENGHFSEALASFQHVLVLAPDNVEALNASASALWAQGNSLEARNKLETALRIAPNNSKVVLNFGEFLAFDEGKIDEGLTYFDRALSLSPNYVQAKWRKSFALLAKGIYREGWQLYAACLNSRDTRGLNKFAPIQTWDGALDPTMRLMIWCEQGLGDSLQFIRFAQLCKQRVGRVSVFCQAPLVRLFNDLPYIDEASDRCDRSSFDAHVPVMNLPHVFNIIPETVPHHPYLSIAREDQSRWAQRVSKAARPGTLKVGLVWAGGDHDENIIAKLTNLQRSISLECLRPWLALSGITFFSLQKDRPAHEMTALGLENTLVNFMNEVGDFVDTAAIVQNLDLVITVDTAVAHLAGGLGKPVWILSRYNADWRWLQNNPQSPWYPTAKIFGQPSMRDWGSVITKVTEALTVTIQEFLC